MFTSQGIQYGPVFQAQLRCTRRAGTSPQYCREVRAAWSHPISAKSAYASHPALL